MAVRCPNCNYESAEKSEKMKTRGKEGHGGAGLPIVNEVVSLKTVFFPEEEELRR